MWRLILEIFRPALPPSRGDTDIRTTELSTPEENRNEPFPEQPVPYTESEA